MLIPNCETFEEEFCVYRQLGTLLTEYSHCEKPCSSKIYRGKECDSSADKKAKSELVKSRN